MRLIPQFEYYQPTDLNEALRLKSEHQQAGRILGGGTDLLVKMRSSRVQAGHLISLKKLPNLDQITWDESSGLVIGANVTIAQAALHPIIREHYPALAYGCSSMGTPQIRNMATVIGNVANGSPSADTACPLICYGATVESVSLNGVREIPIDHFFTGPSKVDLNADEIVQSIRVPALDPDTNSRYLRLSGRSTVDIAAIGSAVCGSLNENGQVTSISIVLGAVAPTPICCADAEKILLNKKPTARLIAQAAQAAAAAASPISDVRASAKYRKSMCEVLTLRALKQCLGFADGDTPQ